MKYIVSGVSGYIEIQPTLAWNILTLNTAFPSQHAMAWIQLYFWASWMYIVKSEGPDLFSLNYLEGVFGVIVGVVVSDPSRVHLRPYPPSHPTDDQLD